MKGNHNLIINIADDLRDVILTEEDIISMYQNFSPDTYDEDDPDVQMFKNYRVTESSYHDVNIENNDFTHLLENEESIEVKDKKDYRDYKDYEMDTKNTEVIHTDQLTKVTNPQNTTEEQKSIELIGRQMQTISNSTNKLNRPMTSIKRPIRPQTAINEKAEDILFKNNAIQNIIFEDKGSDNSYARAQLEKEIQQNIEIGGRDIFNLNPNKQNLYKLKLTKSSGKYKGNTSNKNSTKDFEVNDMLKVENIKVNI